MSGQLLEVLQQCRSPYMTDMEVEIILKNASDDSRYGKIKRLIAQGKLLRIRRGLYGIAPEVNSKSHPFELAQVIYGPSYISLESALNFYKLIPEAVYTVTSATVKRSKEFSTPLGIFSYSHLPLDNFYTEVELIKESSYQFLIAKPWKAICDYVFCYRKDWNSLEPLVNSLRIGYENLPMLENEKIELLNEYYHQRRINRFLKGVQRDLNKLNYLNRGSV